VNEQLHLISGAAGALEARLAVPPARQPQTPFIVCAHPHPQHGGSLQNKVVHTLAKSAYASGLAACRFNFRGVGQSQGEYGHGAGEQEDLLSVVHWMRLQFPQAPCWLAGFSFGGYVTAAAHARAEARLLLLVAPAVNLFDVDQLQINAIPWHVLMDPNDEVVPVKPVRVWIEQQAVAPKLEWLEGVGHFFHGKLAILAEHSQRVFEQHLTR
jgi:alpha/beta superfamily hydrolase